jgi:hypothetical protein
MAAFLILSGGQHTPLPNAPSKISVPLINSAPGKNCLVPEARRADTKLRRVRTGRNVEHADKFRQGR